jgi:hypothetical protein
MENTSDTFPLLFILVLLVLIIGVFIRISIGLRRGGGSLTTVILGATDEFLTQEKSKAAETITNENAGKRFEGQGSGEPNKDPHSATSQ